MHDAKACGGRRKAYSNTLSVFLLAFGIRLNG